jgi:hypothetical protein
MAENPSSLMTNQTLHTANFVRIGLIPRGGEGALLGKESRLSLNWLASFCSQNCDGNFGKMYFYVSSRGWRFEAHDLRSRFIDYGRI